MPTPTNHALLSASSAHRWLACTAAPRFEEQFPSGTSEYAEEGQTAHSVCELYAQKHFTPMTKRKFNAELKKLTNRPYYSDEMLKTAEAYVEYLNSNAIVTPEGHYLVWAADGSADAVDGLINIPVICGQITTGTKITITGVNLSSDSGESYTAGDDTGTVLTIDSNPYATQSICDALYTAFNGLVYFPYTATKALYDPATELGDQVKIGDMVHSVLFTSKLDFDLNFRSDISSPNSESLSEEYPYLSEIQKLKQTTEQLNGAIESAAKELSGNSRIKKGYNGTGTALHWWLRSPLSSSSTGFCSVSSGGNSYSSNANNSYGVAFGFCI